MLPPYATIFIFIFHLLYLAFSQHVSAYQFKPAQEKEQPELYTEI
jgi:hypothetical protein